LPVRRPVVVSRKQVAALVRAHGMRLVVELGPLFDNSPFSTVQRPKQALSLDAFERERATGAKQIIAELHPDYLNIGSEPDTEAALEEIKGINTPDGWARAVSAILDLIGDRQGVKVGAGAGSWSPQAFHRALVTQTSIDYLSAHVYPVTDRFIETSLAVIALAKANGKEALIDEAWLTKDQSAFPGASNMNA
jgi:hypothetical protein